MLDADIRRERVLELLQQQPTIAELAMIEHLLDELHQAITVAEVRPAHEQGAANAGTAVLPTVAWIMADWV